jgi:hypothetical protein
MKEIDEETKKRLDKPVNPVKNQRAISIDVFNNSWCKKEVDLFGAADNIHKLNSKGDYKKGGVRITNNLISSKYSDILYHTITNPIKDLQLSYLIRISRTTKWIKFFNYFGLFKNCSDFIVKNALVVNSVNAYADMYERTIHITADPYQMQMDVLLCREKIVIDAFTKIKISMFPKTHIRFMFFIND